MCSASVGTEASVTLQLRDVNSNDSIQSNQSSSEAAAAAATIITSTTNNSINSSSNCHQSGITGTTTSLDNALTIGYPDPEMLADVLGTLQTACKWKKLNTIKIKRKSFDLFHIILFNFLC